MARLSSRSYRAMDRARLGEREVARIAFDFRTQLRCLHAAHEEYKRTGLVKRFSDESQALVDMLCLELEVAPKHVFLRDRPRPHKRKGGRIVYELHGLCQSNGPVEVYTRTAAREQPVALKTYLNTLLHEWVHHWDFETFGTSIHCGGFYERVGQVYRPARDIVSQLTATTRRRTPS